MFVLLGHRYSYRRYGRLYGKKDIPSHVEVPVLPIEQPIIPKVPVAQPVNICPQIVCPYIYIPDKCRKETFTNIYGVVCKGCDQNICENNGNFENTKIDQDQKASRGDIPEMPKFDNQFNGGSNPRWLDTTRRKQNSKWQSSLPVSNNIHWQNNVPVWQNNDPINSQWQNNGPLDAQWHDNNMPFNTQWQNNRQINNQWQNSFQGNTQWLNNDILNNQWQNSIQGNTQWPNTFPVNNDWQNNLASNNQWQNSLPVNNQWQNNMPNSNQWQATVPVNAEWQNPLNFPVNNQWQAASASNNPQGNSGSFLGDITQSIPSANIRTANQFDSRSFQDPNNQWESGPFQAPNNQWQNVPGISKIPPENSLPLFKGDNNIGSSISGLPMQITGKSMDAMPVRVERDQSLGFADPLYNDLTFGNNHNSISNQVYDKNTPGGLQTMVIGNLGGK